VANEPVVGDGLAAPRNLVSGGLTPPLQDALSERKIIMLGLGNKYLTLAIIVITLVSLALSLTGCGGLSLHGGDCC